MMDNPVEPAGGGPYDPSLGQRVSRLEGEVQELRATMTRVELIVTRIEAALPHLATKAELADMRSDIRGEIADMRSDLRGEIAGLRSETKDEFASVRAELAEKPS